MHTPRRRASARPETAADAHGPRAGAATIRRTTSYLRAGGLAVVATAMFFGGGVVPHAGVMNPGDATASVEHIELHGVDAAASTELRSDALASASPPWRITRDESLARATQDTKILTTALEATEDFSTFGVSWPGVDDAAADLHFAVRTRSAEEGTWSAWTEMEQESPDPSSPNVQRTGTAPMWAGPSDAIQVRIDAQSDVPDGIRVDLIDPGLAEGTSGAGSGLDAASAATAVPDIMTRAQWGADESRVNGAPGYVTDLRAGIVHHTAGTNGYSRDDVPAIIRGIYEYHTGLGWSDIGYNFLVDQYGRIWEGRAGGIDHAVRGAHAGGFNANTLGVSMLGNYETTAPTDEALQAVARILAYKFALHGIDPHGTTTLTSAGGGTARYPAGQMVQLETIIPHRSVGYTTCAGTYVVHQMGTIRDYTARRMG